MLQKNSENYGKSAVIISKMFFKPVNVLPVCERFSYQLTTSGVIVAKNTHNRGSKRHPGLGSTPGHHKYLTTSFGMIYYTYQIEFSETHGLCRNKDVSECLKLLVCWQSLSYGYIISMSSDRETSIPPHNQFCIFFQKFHSLPSLQYPVF